MTPATVEQFLRQALQLGLDRGDAQMLLLAALAGRERPLSEAANSLGAGRAWLVANASARVSAHSQTVFSQFIQRRQAQEPVAYILGRKAFFGLMLHINRDVLDPRDDTETLVDWALRLDFGGPTGCSPALAATAGDAQRPEPPTGPPPQDRQALIRALDLGTGSGAVALALKSQRPDWQVWATDTCAKALTVARLNASEHQLAIDFFEGDWFAALPPARGDEGAQPAQFALIVSNPPYIAQGDPHLRALHHEPAQALSSGADGLDAIRAIVHGAPAHLAPNAWLLLEHGFDQAQAVCALLRGRGFVQVQTHADLSGQGRCSGGQWPGSHAKA